MSASRSQTTEPACKVATLWLRCRARTAAPSLASRPWCASSVQPARSCSARVSPISLPPHNADMHQPVVTFTAVRSRSTLSPGERIYGLGQHQHGLLDQKGAVIELIQRNTEVCIPFALSNRGYGFFWNMAGVGRVELGTNRTRWVADAARQIDYWVTAGPSPADLVSHYTKVTGLPPMLPQWASGFWQCKLRYRTQDELLEVAREHKRRGLPSRRHRRRLLPLDPPRRVEI